MVLHPQYYHHISVPNDDAAGTRTSPVLRWSSAGRGRTSDSSTRTTLTCGAWCERATKSPSCLTAARTALPFSTPRACSRCGKSAQSLRCGRRLQSLCCRSLEQRSCDTSPSRCILIPLRRFKPTAQSNATTTNSICLWVQSRARVLTCRPKSAVMPAVEGNQIPCQSSPATPTRLQTTLIHCPIISPPTLLQIRPWSALTTAQPTRALASLHSVYTVQKRCTTRALRGCSRPRATAPTTKSLLSCSCMITRLSWSRCGALIASSFVCIIVSSFAYIIASSFACIIASSSACI